MRKKFLYIGITLLVVGIIVGLVSPSYALPAQFTNPAVSNLTLNSNGLANITIPLSQTGMIVVTFNSTSPIDFYLANASAYQQLKNAGVANSSARSIALSLQGRGVYEVYTGASSGAYPYIGLSIIPKPAYLLNVTSIAPGTYFALFANPGSKAAQVRVSLLPVSLTQLQSSTSSLGTFFTGAFLLVIGGIGCVIFAFVSKKDDAKSQQEVDKAAEAEYAKLEKKGSMEKKGKGK